MPFPHVNTIFEQVQKIEDSAERLIYWHRFKLAFDQLTPEEQDIYRKQSEEKAREILEETYKILGTRKLERLTPLEFNT